MAIDDDLREMCWKSLRKSCAKARESFTPTDSTYPWLCFNCSKKLKEPKCSDCPMNDFVVPHCPETASVIAAQETVDRAINDPVLDALDAILDDT